LLQRLKLHHHTPLSHVAFNFHLRRHNKAYRAAARAKHPDNGGDQMEFYGLAKAYAVLRDSEKRAMYDEFGEAWVEQAS